MSFVGSQVFIVFTVILHLLISNAQEFELDNPDEQTFDFIIVGAGAAGGVVASRLSEIANVSVLLLEAGGVPHPSTNVPFNLSQTWGHSATDWMIDTTPQKYSAFGFAGRRVRFAQGKMLGGTGNHNGLIFLRGNPRDFDRWADVTGDQQWSYNRLLPFFKMSETYQGNFPVGDSHGTEGPISVSELSYRPLAEEWVRTGRELGYPYTDPNSSQQQSSFFHTQANIGMGRRSSTYQAYLKPVLSRPNLKVLTNAYVTKINLGPENRAEGVTFLRHSQLVTVKARLEVIVSAGAFKSPQLLMLSGIGNPEHLKRVGIEPKVHLPGVGGNLLDHVSTFVGPFLFNQPVSFVPSRDLCSNSTTQYEQKGEGPFSSNMITGTGFWSSTGEHHFPNLQVQQALGNTISQSYPTLEGIARYDGHIVNADLANIILLLGRPLSKGSVTLKSSDPFDPPVVDPNYYAHPEDLKAMVEGMKFIINFYEAGESYQKYGAKLIDRHFPGCEMFPLRSNEYYQCYIQHFTVTGHHFSSTCKMGRADDPLAVVDTELRVRGVGSLRVVDASVMPSLTNTNTNAPTIMIGEKGADLIARSWGLKRRMDDLSNNVV